MNVDRKLRNICDSSSLFSFHIVPRLAFDSLLSFFLSLAIYSFGSFYETMRKRSIAFRHGIRYKKKQFYFNGESSRHTTDSWRKLCNGCPHWASLFFLKSPSWLHSTLLVRWNSHRYTRMANVTVPTLQQQLSYRQLHSYLFLVHQQQ